MRVRFYFALLLIFAASAFGAVALTEKAQVTLIRSSTTVGIFDGWDACKAEARKRATADTRTSGSVTYRCQTERYQIVAAYSPDPQPPPPPDPVPPPSGDTIRHGQPFTVVGSGFGSKPSAAPLAFDDFESGAAGAAVPGKAAVVGRWLSNDYCTGITYGTQDGHKVAKHTFAGGTYNASLCVDPAPTQTVYLDFWAKGVPRANPSRNWKVWRFYSASDADVGNLVYYCRGGGVELGSWVWLPEVPPPLGWVHYEVIQRPGGSRHYRNGKLDSSSSSAPSVAQIRIGHYWGLDGVPDCGSNPGGDVYTDDVYVDNSVARVVLANASTFDGSTKRQVQRATAWAGTEAKIVGNTRGFVAGETAYVLVMDAGNVQRQALKVTVQ